MRNDIYRTLIAACMAGLPALPLAQAWAGALDANRKLIIVDGTFPADKYILDQACVMIELYYRLDEDEALVYDPEEPEVVFGRVSIRNLFAKQADDSLARARETTRLRIHGLARLPASEWNEDQKAMRRMFPPGWNEEDMLASADRMICRRGMRRSFRVSLENSGPYSQLMDSTFRAEGLPTRLKYLAHVESNFNPAAVASSGAAGIWQFMESSGSRYLVIDEKIDQRMDPRAASLAAAKFLKACRRNLASWPLAIMAYNNGPGQMLDAVKETGSREASDIIKNYQGDGFGAVSRNYYAMFLAASSLGMRAETLFPSLRKHAPLPFRTLKLEHEWTPRQLRILSGYSTAVLMRYNPALRPVVFERNLPVPKGFDLILPAGLPSMQDLQFADLRIGTGPSGGDQVPPRNSLAGFPMPKFAENAIRRIRRTLFSDRHDQDIPVMAFMHSQGLLDADRLALAREDRILIEPHPALQAMIRDMGGREPGG